MNKPSVFDVAKYILEKRGEELVWKLQKLVFYCQAWSLVWDKEPMFYEPIEAWENGPVVRDLFYAHRGKFKISADDIRGDVSKLEKHQRETIDAVLRDYGSFPSHYLSDLVQMEKPWIDARKSSLEQSEAAIPLESLLCYYRVQIERPKTKS